MKIKTAELTGDALNVAVAQAAGKPCSLYRINHRDRQPAMYVLRGDDGITPAYSTDWSQAGPIIEREKLTVAPYQDGGWLCTHPTDRWHGNKSGPTPLIAAMRCYVASKLGDEVEIPEELL
jgi:hypothetical protein